MIAGSVSWACAALPLSASETVVSAESAGHGVHELGVSLPLVSVLPFVLLLLAIAVLPLVAGHWWEHNRNKAIVAALLSAPILLYFLPVWDPVGRYELTEKLREFASFILLLGALYVISGGIYIGGSLPGTPLANTAMLALGGLLASFIGTTGASVLLVRPLLRRTRRANAKCISSCFSSSLFPTAVDC